MKSTDFVLSVEFIDGVKVELGGGSEMFVTPAEDDKSAALDDEKLTLLRRIREASEEPSAA